MKNLEEFKDKVYARLEKEYNSFCDVCLLKTKHNILNSAYEIAIKEEIVSSFIANYYSEEQYLALLEEENMLDSLYRDWMDSEGGIHVPIEENIDDEVIDDDLDVDDDDDLEDLSIVEDEELEDE